MDFTFGEQVKILLKRKNMTIKELAEMLESETGKPTSRQNLTQKLNRDNFQEQDMRDIAMVLGCRLVLELEEERKGARPRPTRPAKQVSQEDTGDYDNLYEEVEFTVEPARRVRPRRPESRNRSQITPSSLKKVIGDVNPLTGKEYLNNTVRKLADRPGFIEVYDASEHQWVQTSESDFIKFQARKRELLGNDYEAPIYI